MIEVVAERIGYYGNEIKNIGTRFEIKSESELGSWMSVNGKMWVKPVQGEDSEEAAEEAESELKLKKELEKEEEAVSASDLI